MEQNPTIIVIDDEEAIVKFMLVALKKMGYSSDFSTDSVNGLDLIKKNKYNIVLLDLFMPKESGLSLLMKIKKLDIKTQYLIDIVHNLILKCFCKYTIFFLEKQKKWGKIPISLK